MKMTPPEIVLWSKEGVDEAQFYRESAACGILKNRFGPPGSFENFKSEEACMLKKSYCFTDRKSSNWTSYCSLYSDGPACQTQEQRICPRSLKGPADYSAGSSLPTNPQLDQENARLAHELVEKRLKGYLRNGADSKSNGVPTNFLPIATSPDTDTLRQDKSQRLNDSQAND